MDKETKDTFLLFLHCWLHETISLCENFLVNVNKPIDIEFNKRRMLEEHYLLTATTMSVRFANKLINHSQKGFKEHLDSFINATKDAVDVRNMREHFDEYCLGKGYKQSDFYKGSNNVIKCDMTSSIHYENAGYLLGNVIAVEVILDECQKLVVHVNKVLNECSK